ncbi:MAG: FAD dependent oxidoreductase [Candidatus Aramenus sulfurataquae]|uniref:FAD-dependent oxidoreductase n=2 Tax=Candidatus Aramenus sulfurataquae TaxID=1326980 RepID=W7KWE6_9CREN|nr:MAG: FAD dependent oxidoreductase [Candidatus Aramenus sulfurataquae]MCL7343547.1 NAD(P)-binding protein [Candidatus Aramenus sulfurataquae]
MKIAIIGGGIAGSSLYYMLKKRGHEVKVLDPRIRRIFPSLIHSMLLKGKDVYLAKKSLEFYREFNVATKEFPSVTIGRVDDSVVESWREVGVEVKEEYVPWLSAKGLVARGGDRLVYVKRLIDSVPVIRERASIAQRGNKVDVTINDKSLEAEVYVLATGPWNHLLFPVNTKSYYCWASLVLNENSLFDQTFVYDYEKGFYSRPFLGVGMRLSIVGDGKTVVASPGTKVKVNPLEVIDKAKERLGKLYHVYTSGEFCEGTPDMRPAYGRLLDNLYYIGGLNGYGAEVGPGVASLLVEMILEGKEDREYLLDRFNGIKDFDLGKEPHEL